MIDHVTLTVSDIEKAKEFYKAALAPLGYKILTDYPEWKLVGMGAGESSDVWVYAGEGSKQPMHIAFVAKNKEEVDAFYKEALAVGGADNGAPGYRKNYTPGYYAAFVHDADKNNIEVVYHDPNPTE